MDEVPFFLNGPVHHENISAEGAEAGAIELLRAIKRLSGLGRSIIVGSEAKFFEMTFTSSYVTMAQFGAIDVEWRRFIRQLDQRSPFGQMPQCVPPDAASHSVGGYDGNACHWAIANASFTLSLPILAEVQEAQIAMDICSCVNGAHVSNGVICRNISKVEHVEVWKEQILDFGYKASSSSTVYENDKYLLKMYLHDHEPPHVHVYMQGNDRFCVAKVRFDQVEVMESERLDSQIRKAVIGLLTENKDAFNRGWIRCRAGQLPNRI